MYSSRVSKVRADPGALERGRAIMEKSIQDKDNSQRRLSGKERADAPRGRAHRVLLRGLLSAPRAW